jgi:hypothetical protein
MMEMEMNFIIATDITLGRTGCKKAQSSAAWLFPVRVKYAV